MNKDKLLILSGKACSSKKSVFSYLTNKYYYDCDKDITTGMYNDYLIFNMPDVCSINSMNKSEIVFRDTLMFDKIYKILYIANINTIESDLYLLIQIIELNKNVILCIDTYNQESLIDINRLKQLLDIPIIIFNSKDYKSIKNLLLSINNNKITAAQLKYSESLEVHINNISNLLNVSDELKRFVSIKLLEGDKTIIQSYKDHNIDILSREVNDYLRNIIFSEVIKERSINISNYCQIIKNQVIIEKQKEIEYKSYTLLNLFLFFLLVIFALLITKITSMLIINSSNILTSYLYFLLSSFFISYIFNFVYNFLVLTSLIQRIYFEIDSIFRKVGKWIIFYIFALGYVYKTHYLINTKEKTFMRIIKYLVPNYCVILIFNLAFNNSFLVFLVFLIVLTLIIMVLSKTNNKNDFYKTYEMPVLREANYYILLKESFYQTIITFLKIFRFTFILFVLIILMLNIYINGQNIIEYILNLLNK